MAWTRGRRIWVQVTGGPGRGKTALMREFAQRAIAAHDDLLVPMGACNAYSGVGDPYLPFCEVLGMLMGDVEARWAVGRITGDHARRLWNVLPLAVQALLEHGPFLIDALSAGPALVTRAATTVPEGADWLTQLKGWVQRERAAPRDLEQRALFAQVTNVLRALASQHPLLVVLDDVQWADTGSASLLFHLGRHLQGSRILVLGAYPEGTAIRFDSFTLWELDH